MLQQEQWLPLGVEEAWSFFSSPGNLARITPPDMGFVIRAPFSSAPLHAGQRIRYTVSPLLRIPLTWVTLITEVDEPHRFVDTQERGPYRRWWHQHTFTPQDGGTLMHDRVEYELPFGPLGDLAHRLLVKRRLQRIFAYRKSTLERLFPLKP
ncbi:MAG TPA: SRPBCC family protein [Flavobacteriales bacterium]